MEETMYSEFYEMEEKHWWFVGRRNIILSLLDQHVDRSPNNRRILDVGCGTGANLRYFSRYGKVTGIDLSKSALQFCNLRGKYDLIQASGEEIPFRDNSFDVITMLDVLEHIEEDAKTLKELYRVLKPRGTLLITVPAYNFLWSGHDFASHHKRRYYRGEFKRKIISAGFEVKRLTHISSILFPIIFFRRMGKKIVDRLFKVERPPESEVKMGSELFNKSMIKIFTSERSFLTRNINFPFGSSLLGIAQKPIKEKSSLIPSISKRPTHVQDENIKEGSLIHSNTSNSSSDIVLQDTLRE